MAVRQLAHDTAKGYLNVASSPALLGFEPLQERHLLFVLELRWVSYTALAIFVHWVGCGLPKRRQRDLNTHSQDLPALPLNLILHSCCCWKGLLCERVEFLVLWMGFLPGESSSPLNVATVTLVFPGVSFPPFLQLCPTAWHAASLTCNYGPLPLKSLEWCPNAGIQTMCRVISSFGVLCTIQLFILSFASTGFADPAMNTAILNSHYFICWNIKKKLHWFK